MVALNLPLALKLPEMVAAASVHHALGRSLAGFASTATMSVSLAPTSRAMLSQATETSASAPLATASKSALACANATNCPFTSPFNPKSASERSAPTTNVLQHSPSAADARGSSELHAEASIGTATAHKARAVNGFKRLFKFM